MAADGQFVTRLVMQEGATSRFEPRTFTRWLGVFLSDIEAMLGPRDPASLSSASSLSIHAMKCPRHGSRTPILMASMSLCT